jgi:tetratricopeptide (TPR) repeat protein
MTTTRRLLASATALLLSAPLYTHADEIDDLGKKVFEVESKVRELDQSFRPPPPPGAELAERRLVDAQLLYQLKNYDEAAILLLDVVERFPNSPAFAESQFLLADCLYQKHDHLSAQRYYTKVVEGGAGSGGSIQQRRYQEALQRLIELALRTGDFGPVEGYLAKLHEVPPSQLLPSVPYVEGKYHFFRGRYNEAQQGFEKIQPGSPYYFQARYFVATVRVQSKDYAGAVPIFENLLTQAAKSDDDKRVQELTHLALGRLHYERNEFPQAIDEYQKVPRNSPLFSDMLYEVAWTFIKNAGSINDEDKNREADKKKKEFEKAFRALDLLLLANPDSPQAPEVRILVGNLEVRLGMLGQAMDIFEKARDEFEPVKKQLETVLSQHGDTAAYFNELIGRNLERFDISVYLPPLAVKWVRAEPPVERVVTMVNDIGDMKRAVKDSEDLIVRLERAVNSPSKVGIFPELASARSRSLAQANVLIDVRTKLSKLRRDMVAPVLSADERNQLDQIGQQRTQLEGKLASLPSQADGYSARAAKNRARLEELDHRVAELYTEIQGMNAELVAAEKYYKDTQAQQKAKPEEFSKLAEEVRGTIEALTQLNEQIRNEIQASRETAGIGDAEVQDEEQAKKDLRNVLARERTLLTAAESRLPGDQRVKVQQIGTIIDHAAQIETQIQAFDTKIDAIVEQRLVDIKATIETEKGHMGEYKTKVESYATESAVVGGEITYASFHNVATRFYDIVVHADVGLIDVSWANKEQKTESLARIKREELRELKLIDDEFQEVLKEDADTMQSGGNH